MPEKKEHHHYPAINHSDLLKFNESPQHVPIDYQEKLCFAAGMAFELMIENMMAADKKRFQPIT